MFQLNQCVFIKVSGGYPTVSIAAAVGGQVAVVTAIGQASVAVRLQSGKVYSGIPFKNCSHYKNAQAFHLGDILSITTGRLCAPNLMDGIYNILNYMSGDDLQTVALGRVGCECKPHLLKQLTWLSQITDEDVADLEASPESNKATIDRLVEKFGEYHVVFPMEAEDHKIVDPMEDATRLGFKGKFFYVDTTPAEPPPSDIGDITDR